MITLIALLVGVGLGYGFRGLVRSDIVKFLAFVKAEEIRVANNLKEIKL